MRMRINKGLSIYIRLMIVVLVVFLGALTIIASAPPPMKWVKPNSTTDDFNKDNYACLHENQQRSSASTGGYWAGGVWIPASGSSRVDTNEGLYTACMQARGWSQKSEEELSIRQPATSQEQQHRKKVKKQSREIGRDGDFIAYDDGTVRDTSTHLMWAAKDNGSNINWEDAKSYCENYRGGGYTDWRLPTMDELAQLYDANESRPLPCYTKTNTHVATKLINITCHCVWSNKLQSVGADAFKFTSGKSQSNFRSMTQTYRALPVRND